jgi:hypothetical protein
MKRTRSEGGRVTCVREDRSRPEEATSSRVRTISPIFNSETQV